MSLNTDTTMQVVPAYGMGYNGNCNNGMFSGDWGWILLFLLFGWGGYGFGGRGFGGGQGGCGAPCATQADVRSAVDQQTLISKLDQQTYGLADSAYALTNTITNGFHGVDSAICNLGYNVQQGFNTIGHQIADCCCTTQRAIDGVRYDAAQQACDTRNLIQSTTRDITDNANANTRAILDFLVQSKLADKDARIAQLEGQVSRAEQTGLIRAAIDASTAEVIRRTGNDCPTPAYWVQPPTPVQAPCSWTHGYNGGCGQGYAFAG